MIGPDHEFRYVVTISEPAGFVFDPEQPVEDKPEVGFSSLAEARRYCCEQSEAFGGLLVYRLYDFFDGVELDY